MNKLQRSNLAKLATYLESLPADYSEFGMDYYVDIDYDKETRVTPRMTAESYGKIVSCGAVACAVGHAPIALGLAPKVDGYGYIDWTGVCEQWLGTNEDSLEYTFMFSSTWSAYDDTPAGAAARIRWYLFNGKVPDQFEPPLSTNRFSDFSEGWNLK